MTHARAGFPCRWIAPIAFALFLAAGCTWESPWFYVNGQIMVVTDTTSGWGEREGVWCYFNPDGTLKMNEETEYGLMDRTGYYGDGKKIRELTPTELERSRRRAEKLMQQHRGNPNK